MERCQHSGGDRGPGFVAGTPGSSSGPSCGSGPNSRSCTENRWRCSDQANTPRPSRQTPARSKQSPSLAGSSDGSPQRTAQRRRPAFHRVRWVRNPHAADTAESEKTGSPYRSRGVVCAELTWVLFSRWSRCCFKSRVSSGSRCSCGSRTFG